MLAGAAVAYAPGRLAFHAQMRAEVKLRGGDVEGARASTAGRAERETAVLDPCASAQSPGRCFA